MLGKGEMAGNFRFEVYSILADRAKVLKIKWVVLHGCEGYPERIGRDLDVFCKSEEDKDALIKEFEICLQENEAKWIIHPNPIWGRRVVGISNNLDVAELHILNAIRVLNVSQSVEWDKVCYKNNNFPKDVAASFFKSCLMPALVNQPRWQNKCEEAVCPKDGPRYLCEISKKLDRKRALSAFEKLLFFSKYHLCNPVKSTRNIVQWLVIKNKIYFSPTVPVFSINKKDINRIICLVNQKLSHIFLGTSCVDDFSRWRIKKTQALQRFIYTTKDKNTQSTIPIDGNQTDSEILHFLIDSFANFN